MLSHILHKWKQYRYRFVPWIAMTLKDRSVRAVQDKSQDKIISDQDVYTCLLNLFEGLYQGSKSILYPIGPDLYKRNLNVMDNVLGFQTERQPSVLPDGGVGVIVTKGIVPNGSIVSMYPGTIYQPYEPTLFQSLGNQFIFRCIDGLLIDGNDRKLSRFVYKSCAQRDRMGPYMTCDISWLTPYPVNPLAVGQVCSQRSVPRV
ncbi:hypothetical protein CHS0354_010869 [Potamilus streckersoni]|uniref:Uncharacterized protein n=1 Tax=Potamilus streckersoni TaxID=2493646 RepID=A0AAE0VYW7_9BIVA|nr:hypothetical protein CHS0354_010869 [Potamilus streckersoni]